MRLSLSSRRYYSRIFYSSFIVQISSLHQLQSYSLQQSRNFNCLPHNPRILFTAHCHRSRLLHTHFLLLVRLVNVALPLHPVDSPRPLPPLSFQVMTGLHCPFISLPRITYIVESQQNSRIYWCDLYLPSVTSLMAAHIGVLRLAFLRLESRCVS